jgi:hypothetical protein
LVTSDAFATMLDKPWLVPIEKNLQISMPIKTQAE